jgi:hypothetical protein
VTITPDTLYQATDLARRHREVMDAARRPGGAIIRDRGGESFLLTPAAPVSRDHYLLEGLRAAVQVLNLLRSEEPRDSVLYGSLSWLSVLPREDQQQFVWEYVRVLQAASGTGVDAVEQLLYEWQQTARAWVDEDLRAELSSDLDEPLRDAEL